MGFRHDYLVILHLRVGILVSAGVIDRLGEFLKADGAILIAVKVIENLFDVIMLDAGGYCLDELRELGQTKGPALIQVVIFENGPNI